jgi:hypothetical protein
MRLIVPAFQIEDDIVDVGGFPGNPLVRDIRLAHNLGVTITCIAGDPIYVAYYTQRSALLVSNGQLRHYPQMSDGTYNVVMRDVATAKPFSVPGGDNHFVKIDLTARDSHTSARGYRGMDLQVKVTVPFRYRVTTHQ